MTPKATNPRTLLLVTIAGWAMLVWVLGLFGLGGRIERLADDPSLAQSLPVLPAAVPERLGPSGQYSEISLRPLFSEDRLPKTFTLQPEGEAQQETFKFVLTSVLLTPRLQLAIIQPEGGGASIRLKVGEAPDSAPSYQLLSLTPRGAVFAGPEGEKTLDLRVFDGSGGEAPTAVTASPATGSRNPVAPRPTGTMTAPQDTQAPRPSTVASNPAPTVVNPPPPPPQTSDAQVEAIRKRIEARRAQLREQSQVQPPQSQPPPPPPAPDKTQ
ncbi:MAG: general secretion pathway protein GspN [Pseudomonadota bacterium]|nr:general secretion pathway protein GspN [Pseudomonadota bacterium]